jgi:hypothetical protein
MPAPQTLTIELSQSETDLFFAIAEEAAPGSSGAWKKHYAEAVAKAGLRAELGRIQASQIRQNENEARAVEKSNFDAAFPEVVVPAPQVPDPPVEE